MNDILATDGASKHLVSPDTFFFLLNYPPQSKSKAFDRGKKVVLSLPSRGGRDPVLEVRVISRISAHFRIRFRAPDSSVLAHLDGVFSLAISILPLVCLATVEAISTWRGRETLAWETRCRSVTAVSQLSKRYIWTLYKDEMNIHVKCKPQ